MSAPEAATEMLWDTIRDLASLENRLREIRTDLIKVFDAALPPLENEATKDAGR